GIDLERVASLFGRIDPGWRAKRGPLPFLLETVPLESFRARASPGYLHAGSGMEAGRRPRSCGHFVAGENRPLLRISLPAAECLCPPALGGLAKWRAGSARLSTRTGSGRGRAAANFAARGQTQIGHRDRFLQRDSD